MQERRERTVQNGQRPLRRDANMHDRHDGRAPSLTHGSLLHAAHGGAGLSHSCEIAPRLLCRKGKGQRASNRRGLEMEMVRRGPGSAQWQAQLKQQQQHGVQQQHGTAARGGQGMGLQVTPHLALISTLKQGGGTSLPRKSAA